MLLTILYPYQTGAAGKRKPSKQEQQQDYDNAYQAALLRRKQREVIKLPKQANKLRKLKVPHAQIQKIMNIESSIDRELAIEVQYLEFKQRENKALALLLLVA